MNRLRFFGELVLHVRIFSTGSSACMIGFLLREIKQERKSALKRLRYCVSQDAYGSGFYT